MFDNCLLEGLLRRFWPVSGVVERVLGWGGTRLGWGYLKHHFSHLGNLWKRKFLCPLRRPFRAPLKPKKFPMATTARTFSNARTCVLVYFGLLLCATALAVGVLPTFLCVRNASTCVCVFCVTLLAGLHWKMAVKDDSY